MKNFGSKTQQLPFLLKQQTTLFLFLLITLCYASLAKGQIVFGGNSPIDLAADNDNTGDGEIRFKAGPDIRMIMKDDGKFGIGTTSPSAPLGVIARSNNKPPENGIYLFNPNNSGNGNAILSTRVGGSNAGDPYLSWDVLNVSGWAMGMDNSDGDKLKIGRNWNSVSANTSMTFDHNGNVGIGTANPNHRLTLKGGDLWIEANRCFRSNGILNFQADDDDSGDGRIYFKAGPDTRMTMRDDGKLGLGTTSPDAQLHIQDIYGSGGKNLMVGDDTYFTDVDVPDLIGLFGNFNKDRAGIELGDKGEVIWGQNSAIGIGGLPDQAKGEKLFVNGRIRFGDSEYIEAVGSHDVVLHGSLRPSGNANSSLGSGSYRWNTIFASNPTINTSDRRDKTQIRGLNYGLEEVLAMRPVTYEWKNQVERGTQVGLIAQELNEVVPNIVFDPAEGLELDKEGNWVSSPVTEESRFGIQYALLTPILVKAIQEQQSQIKVQQAQIEEQREDIEELQVLYAGEALRNVPENGKDLGLPGLYQNVPNPFDHISEIKYFLPESVQCATLYVYDMQGNPILETVLGERGEGSYTIDGTLLSAGMYLYALVADGQEVDVKRMIITKGE